MGLGGIVGRARITVIDWIMLALALVSVGMLSYETWGNPNEEQRAQILLGDLIIVGIFALEFSVRWAKAENRRTFPLRNWYEVLGMIPVASPAIRGFRLFRIIRIVVLLSRFGYAADRAFGDEFTYRFVRRFKAAIVESLGDAVTLRVMDMTLDVLQKGEYAGNMADHLERNGDAMLEIVIDKVREDPKIGRVRHLPFFDDLVATSSRVTTRLVIDLLRDDRMDQMIKDIIKENVEQIRNAVKRNEALKGPSKAAA